MYNGIYKDLSEEYGKQSHDRMLQEAEKSRLLHKIKNPGERSRLQVRLIHIVTLVLLAGLGLAQVVSAAGGSGGGPGLSHLVM